MSDSVFKDLKCYIISCNDSKVPDLLDKNGAASIPVLSDSLNFAISDNTDSEEVEEARDIYAVPVVTSKWVLDSLEAGFLLPYELFHPAAKRLFDNCVFVLSELSMNDSESINGYVSVLGGKILRQLNATTTHVIVGKATGEIYDYCCSHIENSNIVIATPDWVSKCINLKKIIPHEPFHPRLLKKPPEPKKPPVKPPPIEPVPPPQTGSLKLKVKPTYPPVPTTESSENHTPRAPLSKPGLSQTPENLLRNPVLPNPISQKAGKSQQPLTNLLAAQQGPKVSFGNRGKTGLGLDSQIMTGRTPKSSKSKSQKHAQEQALNEEEKDAIVMRNVMNILSQQHNWKKDSDTSTSSTSQSASANSSTGNTASSSMTISQSSQSATASGSSIIGGNVSSASGQASQSTAQSSSVGGQHSGAVSSSMPGGNNSNSNAGGGAGSGGRKSKGRQSSHASAQKSKQHLQAPPQMHPVPQHQTHMTPAQAPMPQQSHHPNHPKMPPNQTHQSYMISPQAAKQAIPGTSYVYAQSGDSTGAMHPGAATPMPNCGGEVGSDATGGGAYASSNAMYDSASQPTLHDQSQPPPTPQMMHDLPPHHQMAHQPGSGVSVAAQQQQQQQQHHLQMQKHHQQQQLYNRQMAAKAVGGNLSYSGYAGGVPTGPVVERKPHPAELYMGGGGGVTSSGGAGAMSRGGAVMEQQHPHAHVHPHHNAQRMPSPAGLPPPTAKHPTSLQQQQQHRQQQQYMMQNKAAANKQGVINGPPQGGVHPQMMSPQQQQQHMMRSSAMGTPGGAQQYIGGVPSHMRPQQGQSQQQMIMHHAPQTSPGGGASGSMPLQQQQQQQQQPQSQQHVHAQQQQSGMVNHHHPAQHSQQQQQGLVPQQQHHHAAATAVSNTHPHHPHHQLQHPTAPQHPMAQQGQASTPAAHQTLQQHHPSTPSAPSSMHPTPHLQHHQQQMQQPQSGQPTPPQMGLLRMPQYVVYDGNAIPTKPTDCLMGCVFLIIGHESYSRRHHLMWRRIIHLHGGQVVTEYDASTVTHVLVDWQLYDPDLFKQAMHDKKRLVTIYWLNDVLQNKTVQPPSSVIHLPSPFSPTCTFSFIRRQMLSLTGFTGQERLRVEMLIKQIGAQFTDHMMSATTILVCKKPDGAKYAAAQKWGIPCVNVRWLQDLYFGDVATLSTDLNPVYLSFELIDVSLKLDVRSVRVIDLMGGWQKPIHITESVCEKFNAIRERFLAEEEQENKKENIPAEKTREKSCFDLLTQEEISLAESCQLRSQVPVKKELIDDKVNDEDAAKENERKLSQTEPMDCDEKEAESKNDSKASSEIECPKNTVESETKVTSQTVEKQPVETVTEKEMPAIDPLTVKQESHVVNEPIVSGAGTKRAPIPLLPSAEPPRKKQGCTEIVRISFTGLTISERQELINLLSKKENDCPLEVEIVPTVQEATHLVARRLVRVPKLYMALAQGKPIVSHKWILASLHRKAWLSEEHWFLRDPSGERTLGVDLAKAQQTSQQLHSMTGAGLFQGLECHISRGCAHAKLCEQLWVAGGGLLKDKRPVKKLASRLFPRQLMLCHENEFHLAAYLLKTRMGCRAVHHEEFILDALMKQSISFDIYQIRHVAVVEDYLKSALNAGNQSLSHDLSTSNPRLAAAPPPTSSSSQPPHLPPSSSAAAHHPPPPSHQHQPPNQPTANSNSSHPQQPQTTHNPHTQTPAPSHAHNTPPGAPNSTQQQLKARCMPTMQSGMSIQGQAMHPQHMQLQRKTPIPSQQNHAQQMMSVQMHGQTPISMQTPQHPSQSSTVQGAIISSDHHSMTMPAGVSYPQSVAFQRTVNSHAQIRMQGVSGASGPVRVAIPSSHIEGTVSSNIPPVSNPMQTTNDRVPPQPPVVSEQSQLDSLLNSAMPPTPTSVNIPSQQPVQNAQHQPPQRTANNETTGMQHVQRQLLPGQSTQSPQQKVIQPAIVSSVASETPSLGPTVNLNADSSAPKSIAMPISTTENLTPAVSANQVATTQVTALRAMIVGSDIGGVTSSSVQAVTSTSSVSSHSGEPSTVVTTSKADIPAAAVNEMKANVDVKPSITNLLMSEPVSVSSIEVPKTEAAPITVQSENKEIPSTVPVVASDADCPKEDTSKCENNSEVKLEAMDTDNSDVVEPKVEYNVASADVAKIEANAEKQDVVQVSTDIPNV